jgi:hypothetical protein
MRSTLGFSLILVAVSGAAMAAVSCSANTGSGKVFGNGGGGSESSTVAGTGSTGTDSTSSGDLFDGGFGGSGSGGSGTSCNSAPGEDNDKDGFTGLQGDCNDCDPNVNPGAVDTPATATGDGGMTMASDNNCDGKIDPAATCDDNLAIDDPDPFNAAKAVDLCQKLTDPKKWGISVAKWTFPDGSPVPAGTPNYDLGHGLLSAFGPNVNVQRGKRMLGLSSGTARAPTDPGYMSVGGFPKGYTAPSPPGFPKESPACPGVITGQPNDAVALELTIIAPTNAHGFSFNFNFFTYEWPVFVCSTYNDFFVALLSPIPMGQSDGNISFDTQGNPVSVNNAFVEVCGCDTGNPPPAPGCNAGGKIFPCSLGDNGLMGTGFGSDLAGQDHASTSWLSTKAPISPHEQITIRWTVYDSGDGVLDTSALVDNWEWIATPGTTVSTTPIPTPK